MYIYTYVCGPIFKWTVPQIYGPCICFARQIVSQVRWLLLVKPIMHIVASSFRLSCCRHQNMCLKQDNLWENLGIPNCDFPPTVGPVGPTRPLEHRVQGRFKRRNQARCKHKRTASRTKHVLNKTYILCK